MNPTPMDWILMAVVGCFGVIVLLQWSIVKRHEDMLEVQVRINDTLIRDLDTLEAKTSWMASPSAVIDSETAVEPPSHVIDKGFLIDPEKVRGPKRYG